MGIVVWRSKHTVMPFKKLIEVYKTKEDTRFTKIIAAFLAMAMVLGSLSSLCGIDTSVKAQPIRGNTDGPYQELTYDISTGARVVLGKGAHLTEDGTYNIDLSAYVVGTPNITQRTVKVPTDYVLVFDASASMKDHYSCQIRGGRGYACLGCRSYLRSSCCCKSVDR